MKHHETPRLMPATQQRGVEEICQLRSSNDGGLLATLLSVTHFSMAHVSRTCLETGEQTMKNHDFSRGFLPLRMAKSSILQVEAPLWRYKYEPEGVPGVIRPGFWAGCWRRCLSTSTPPVAGIGHQLQPVSRYPRFVPNCYTNGSFLK